MLITSNRSPMAQRTLLVQERDRHHRLRDVARALRALAYEARIALEILDHERLTSDERPAGDARARGEARAHQVFRAFAGDCLEHELVGPLVVQEDRSRPRREDRARDLDDRLEQCPVLLLGRHDARRDGGLQVVIRHSLPPTLDAVR
jgi:hypothetical protein